ncbi:MAG: hydrolase [Streptosporangiales bacterium]|nr:hydrolase [Streptosporangiales bacterium]
MKVACAQYAAGTDKDANLKTLGEQVASAAGQGARAVVAPEYAMFLSAHPDQEMVDAAEPLDGPFATEVARLAREHRVALVAEMSERIPGEPRIFNTVVAYEADGRRLGTYRKLHMFDAFGWKESDWVRPGEPRDLLTFTVDGVTFGVLTCYDLRFPELARAVADQGAQVLVIPAAWVAGPRKEDHWATLARARAIENTAYVVAAGQAPPMCAGHSMVVDPMGVPVAQLGETPGIAVGEVSAERLDAVRTRNPCLAHRRFRVTPR